MKFGSALTEGVLIRRYKRFLADVRLIDDTEITVHCPNTGAMTGCSAPGSRVWISTSNNPKRKYPNTLEIIEPLELVGGAAATPLVGVNPGKANALVEEAINANVVESLKELAELQREVGVPDEAGRFDFGFIDASGQKGFVEVKSVTLCTEEGVGEFPDAVSERALRHVQALERRVDDDERGVLLFCVQHTGVDRVRCAAEIYPEYAQAVSLAASRGVEVLAYRCDISPAGLEVSRQLPVELLSGKLLPGKL